MKLFYLMKNKQANDKIYTFIVGSELLTYSKLFIQLEFSEFYTCKKQKENRQSKFMY